MPENKRLEIRNPTDDPPEGSMLMCMKGPSRLGVVESVNGTCSQCGTQIHFSIQADPRLPKICTDCGFKGAEKVDFAITESTVSEALEVLGYPDNETTREALRKVTSLKMNAELERRKKNANN